MRVSDSNHHSSYPELGQWATKKKKSLLKSPYDLAQAMEEYGCDNDTRFDLKLKTLVI